MSLITDFNKKPGEKALGVVKEVGGLPGAANTLKDIKGIADTVNGIFGSVERLVNRFHPQQQPQGSTTSSPLEQERAMNTGEVQEKKHGPAPAPGAPDNKSIEQFFSTPAGMAKIVEAIDQFTPLIGDAKLSEVKGFLLELQKKPKEKKK